MSSSGKITSRGPRKEALLQHTAGETEGPLVLRWKNTLRPSWKRFYITIIVCVQHPGNPCHFPRPITASHIRRTTPINHREWKIITVTTIHHPRERPGVALKANDPWRCQTILRGVSFSTKRKYRALFEHNGQACLKETNNFAVLYTSVNIMRWWGGLNLSSEST
ncbi:hypothetical protein CEXT_630591 [Caerostris extrusa]|uniref:PH domain-containing protein n=1 Tax=Caerostris extrusa TaxID=172846 RepID=A0AAV4SIY5_CAEEX|nr:hypothetical protein CEXT_630591 [Caerostris extrusa]